MSPTLLHLITYACLFILVLAVLIRSSKILSMPLHLRWELYPVAHESGKASYGGSYLEEIDWWKKKRRSSLWGELKVMIPEILFLEAVWKNNRRLWFRSWSFHFGLYLLVLTVLLLIIGAIMQIAGVPFEEGASPSAALLVSTTGVIGTVALILAALGSLGLLQRRLTDKDLKDYSSFSHIFNLLFFLAALVAGLYVAFGTEGGVAATRGYVTSLIGFDLAAPTAGPAVTTMVLLFSLLAAYVPLTHMSHFFTKYFMYHHVRWDDAPNMKGGEIEKKVQEYLNYKVTWSAPHIKGDGNRTWVDVALDNPFQEEDK